MNKCPHCRGQINTTHQCLRCGADLELRFTIEQQANYHCHRAIAALQERQYSEANLQIERALVLTKNDFSIALQGFICSSSDLI